MIARILSEMTGLPNPSIPESIPPKRPNLDNTCVTYILPNELTSYIFLASKPINSLKDNPGRAQNDNQFDGLTIIFSTNQAPVSMKR